MATVSDSFFSFYQGLIVSDSLPYQYSILTGERSFEGYSAIDSNLKKAASGIRERFVGFVFQDSDFYKWLEAVGYALKLRRDSQLEAHADYFIDLLEKAQDKDGYINTYFMLNECDRRYTDLQSSHELYCAGHFFEAVSAYYSATKNEKLLRIATKWADGLVELFLNGGKKGYPGHEEIELGLVRLYELTGKRDYLDLALHFIYERGQSPLYFIEETKARGGRFVFNGWQPDERLPLPHDLKYSQSHEPVLEQKEAVGHAVRAVYLLTGMAGAAKYADDTKLFDAAKRLYNNITSKKMYVTGGIGSTGILEAFTGSYDLPPDTAYAETCAAAGLVFLCRRLLMNEMNSSYADTMETAIYNGLLSGIALDGKKYFYVNPLRSDPSVETPIKGHVKNSRQDWFSCACCPPNLARLVLSIADYAVINCKGILLSNLFIAGKYNFGSTVIEVEADYPLNKTIRYTLHGIGTKFGIRIPAYAKGYSFTLNNKVFSPEIINGYAMMELSDGDVMEYTLEFAPARIYTNSRVFDNIGCVAVRYGQFIMCLEHCDNDFDIFNSYLPQNSELKLEVKDIDGLGLTPTITASGCELTFLNDELYFEAPQKKERNVCMRFIPYYKWANRGEGQMTVFVREK